MMATATRNVLALPIAPLLDDAGVEYRKVVKRTGTWYNLRRCPVCQKEGSFECGVREELVPTAARGGAPARELYVHVVKCWHQTGDVEYGAFLLSLGVTTSSELAAIAEESRATHERSLARSAQTGRPPASDFVKKRMRRLRQSPKAMAWLAARQLTVETAERFYLGLAEEYTDNQGVVHSDALTYPIIEQSGRYTKRNGCYNIPGVTKNPADTNGWMKGEVLSYFSDSIAGRRELLVVEGAKDLWRLDQFLQTAGVSRSLVLLTSTHGSAVPAEWKDPAFWRQWDKVYLGHDTDAQGDAIALSVAELAGRDVLRVRLPLAPSEGKDWTDWLNSAPRTADAFVHILDAATPASLPVPVSEGAATIAPSPDVAGGPARISYDPVDIASAFRSGHLYYATETLVRGEGTEYLETVVVRSDRTMHRAKRSKVPQDVHESRAVIRLVPDGALLERAPAPSSFATWRWKGIHEFLQGARPPRHLRDVLRDVEGHLRAAVWLPYETDYTLLAAVVVVTYLQAVFSAVPLLLVTGPKGTGKTALGRAMHALCANSSLIGQSSAATIARLIDQSRGFVVLDDLEGVASKSDNAQFGELVQALKLSYNKATAVKLWTDVKTMRTVPLNFYGVKLINNTQGVDEILGSRMLKIQTRRMPGGITVPAAPAISAEDLRQELHRWAFEHAADIAEAYQQLPNATDRDAEIAMPVLAVAAVADDAAFTARLQAALEGSTKKGQNSGNPHDVLELVVRRLIQQGYRSVSPTHVSLEMMATMESNYDRASTTEIPLWQRTEWIGKQLRMLDLVDQSVDERRIRMHGLSLRFLKLRQDLVQDVLDAQVAAGVEPGDIQAEVSPSSFCLADQRDGGRTVVGCMECPFRTIPCPIREKRLAVGPLGAR